jgi:excisionase family DNA binding protein
MPYLTVEELERDSKISRYTWRSWIKQGRIAAIRAGRRVRVSEEDYRAFMRPVKARVPEAR